MDYNGSSFEIGRLLGKIEAHMEHQNATQDYHTEILLDLPSKIASAISIQGTSASPSPSARILPEVSDLLRALYPLLILAIAGFGKATWPTALPLIRDMLEVAMKASGTS